MTRQQLRNYISLKGEIAELQRELDELEQSAPIVTDSVQGSSTQPPYSLHTIEICGIDPFAVTRINAKRSKLQRMILQLEHEREEVLAWIESIPDSTVRRIFRLHYIDGLNWIRISHRIEPYRSPDAVRKIHDRFLKKI